MPVKTIIVGEERRARPEGQDHPLSTLRLGDRIGGEESLAHQLPQMRAELIALNQRPMRVNLQPTKPFAAYVVVAFWESQPVLVVSVEEVGEVKEQPHVESLADGAEL